MNIKNRLIENIDEFKEEAFDLNKYLFDNPELSGQEYGSVKKIKEILTKYNIFLEDN